MDKSTMKSAVQGMLLFFMMLSVAGVSDADELSSRLQTHFDHEREFRYLKYERIDQVHADEYGSMSYLVMDFDLIALNHDPQGSVHQICSRVLKDRSLIQDLSRSGYDMVSVSFDRQNQYDCL